MLKSSTRPDVFKSERSWWRTQGIAATSILLAFGLRVFHLDTQSLWGDEMFSVFRAAETLAEITAAVPRETTLPPLYYYLLHFWIPLAGSSEFAVRFPSLLAGVLAVPLLYQLVRLVLGRPAALIAAIIGTLSPFWIYYSQETRTYALFTTLLILALYLLVRSATDDRWQHSFWAWGAYVVAATLTLASYYFAGFALAAAVLWVLANRRAWPSVAIRCVLAQVSVLVLLSPLLIYTATSLVGLAGEIERGGVPLTVILDRITVAFNFGSTVESDRILPLVVVALVIATIGLASAPWRAAVFWALLLVVPILATYQVSFVQQVHWERYFLTATPAWYALLAAGLTWLAFGPNWRAPDRRAIRSPGQGLRPGRQRAAGLGLAVIASAVLLLGVGISLRNYYFDPTYWRFDFRSAIAQIETPPTSDAAIIVNGPEHYPSFFYYYRNQLPAVELPERPYDQAKTVETLAGMADRYRGLWLAKYNPPEYDPDAVVSAWLAQHAFAASSRWVENATFSLYLTEDPAQPNVVASFPVGRTFSNDAELASYRATLARTQHRDYLLVKLTWRAMRTPDQPISVFAHLLDRAGQRLAQNDHVPVDGLRPTRTWQPGDLIEDRFALELPPDYASRGLRLAIGLYHPNGDRLPIDGSASPDHSLRLPLPGLNPLGDYIQIGEDFAEGFSLLGYQLSPTPVQSGGTLSLTLIWQANQRIGADYTVFNHVLDANQQLVAQQDAPPLGGERPTSSWLVGEVIADQYEITIPPNTEPGRYDLELGMYEPTTGRRVPLSLAGSQATDNAEADRVLLSGAVTVARH